MLAKGKLNSTETLVSQVRTGMEVSHEEFTVIFLRRKINMRK